MNNFDMNQLANMLGKLNKEELEKAVSQAKQIMNSKDRDQIIDNLKNKMK